MTCRSQDCILMQRQRKRRGGRSLEGGERISGGTPEATRAGMERAVYPLRSFAGS